MLIGPITDLLTFYSDLWLADRMGKLSHAGDHFYQNHGTPASWADGNIVVIGETSIDFDVTLADINPSDKVATLNGAPRAAPTAGSEIARCVDACAGGRHT
jgi:hypothetical protein